jgi:hypothetical protein
VDKARLSKNHSAIATGRSCLSRPNLCIDKPQPAVGNWVLAGLTIGQIGLEKSQNLRIEIFVKSDAVEAGLVNANFRRTFRERPQGGNVHEVGSVCKTGEGSPPEGAPAPTGTGEPRIRSSRSAKSISPSPDA